MNEKQEGTKVPNRRVQDLVEALHYHHQTVRKKDEFGVKLYKDALEAYLATGKLPVGKSGYLLNRLHPKGRWSSYYSKVHIKEAKTKQEHPLILYFKQRPEELVLSTEGFAKDVKEEVKLYLAGSNEAYEDWINSIILNEQVRLISQLMTKITSDRPLRQLPTLVKTCLLKAIGKFLMGVGPDLGHDDVILLRSLLVANGVQDIYKVFG